MDTTTINGLHKCQPKNVPEQGETKNMVVVNMPAKGDKKAWIKISNKKQEEGGSPYRILNVEPLPWEPDTYGNLAFNIEVEASTSAPSQVQQLRKIVKGEPEQGEYFHEPDSDWPEVQQGTQNAPQSPPAHSNGELDMVRRRLMQAVNLEVLCIRAVDKGIAPHCPEIARTAEFFQSQVASLFIWATRQGLENKMPETPIQ